ncbi:MAG TPA: DUF1127 domain-containing protein [Kiloniellales bacterium]|nr:DUF1127 domain-containing protein [Kiloniellales bacterium]
MSQDRTNVISPTFAKAGRTPRREPGSPLRRILDRLLLWQARAAERRQLAEMSDHLLKDMGLTRADVSRECAKPFWRL